MNSGQIRKREKEGREPSSSVKIRNTDMSKSAAGKQLMCCLATLLLTNGIITDLFVLVELKGNHRQAEIQHHGVSVILLAEIYKALQNNAITQTGCSQM